jgi:hypothetical protein
MAARQTESPGCIRGCIVGPHGRPFQNGANRTFAEKGICPKEFLHEKEWMNQASVRFAPFWNGLLLEAYSVI